MPPSQPREGWQGTPPPWARVLWEAAAVVALAGGVYLIAQRSRPGLAVAAVGLVGLVVLAVANGYWMHGRPNPRHHVVRIAAVLVILGLAVAGTR